MRLIDADEFEVVGGFVPEEYAEMTEVYLAGNQEILEMIDSAPTVDAEPVRHARWNINKRYGDYECPECGAGDFTAPDFKRNNMRYCPNCGAKMDAEVRDVD